MGIKASESEIASFLAGKVYREAMAIFDAPIIEELDPNISEADFQAKILEIAKASGWKSYHTHDSRRSTAGFPDLVMARGNCFLLAELKRTKGTVSDDQEQWIDAIKKTSVPVFVWRPADWPEIVKLLTAKAV